MDRGSMKSGERSFIISIGTTSVDPKTNPAVSVSSIGYYILVTFCMESRLTTTSFVFLEFTYLSLGKYTTCRDEVGGPYS